MIGNQAEAQVMDLGEGLTGDPGDLRVKLCLGHVLSPEPTRQPVPAPARTGSGEAQDGP